MTRTVRLLLGASFFLSGGTALVYQVLWSKHLQHFFGSKTEAVSAILAVFMAGLGLGAYVLGRRVDRSPSALRFYGLLEAGIGVWGLLAGPLLSLAGRIYVAQGEVGALQAGLSKIALAALVLLPPCLLMGGTLPALLRAVSDNWRAAQRFVGLFYALNLLGAVAGTITAGFWLIESLGLGGTARLAAGINLAIGAAVMLVARLRQEPASQLQDEGGSSGGGLAVLLRSRTGCYTVAGLFLSGATVMACEIAFTRVLVLVFGVSVYAFTIVLAVFLLGLGIGAAVYERWVSRREVSVVAFAGTQILLAALGAGAIAALPRVPRLVLYLRQIPEQGFWEVLAGKSLLVAGLVLPLAAVAGLGLPILIGSLIRGVDGLGTLVGRAYLVNTLGTVVGSLLTGFGLIAALGTEGTLRTVFLVNATTGLIGLLWLGRGWRVRTAGVLAAGIAAAGVLGAAGWPPTLFIGSDTGRGHTVATSPIQIEDRLRSTPNEVIFFREGRNATVAVTRTPRMRSLLVNGHPDGSDADRDMATQVMLGAIPLAVHGEASAALIIGHGTGVTARAAARLPEIERIDVVEIEPAVVEASPLFHHVNGEIERDPRARVLLQDARSFVAATPERYDVVISEPSNPWRAGVANLYSADFFEAIRQVLRARGVFAQWMHLYSIRASELRIVLRTISAVFPEIQIWWLDAGNVVILASQEELRIDRARFEMLLDGEFREDRARYSRAATMDEFYARVLLDTERLETFLTDDDPIHDDDRPSLEYRAPRGLYASDDRNALRLLSAKLTDPPVLAPVDGAAPPLAAFWLGVAAMYDDLGRPAEQVEATRRAVALGSVSGRIRAAEIELGNGNVSAASGLLASLASVESSLRPEVAQELAFAKAHLHAARGESAEARAAWERTGEMEGEAGMQALQWLAATGRRQTALTLADRLLRSARLGGKVGPAQVERIHVLLFELAASTESAREALRLAETLPDPAAGFSDSARLTLVALLNERLGRHEAALAACEAFGELGLLDLPVLRVQVASLRALGREAEARRLERRLVALDPESALEPIPSPLLGEEGRPDR